MELKPIEFSPTLHSELTRLSESLQQSLSQTQYTPPPSATISIKQLLQTLIPTTISPQNLHTKITDFALCCAALASSHLQTTDPLLSWIPNHLSLAAESAFQDLQKACDLEPNESLVTRLMPQVMPLLKGVVKESSIDAKEDGDEISAASARSPVAPAVVAAYQFRWFVTQVDYPSLGRLCSWVIPCALTTVDHWSPAVKGQGMISFIHIAKNVNVADLACYEDVLLDLCFQNIACDDTLWNHVVQMSVLLLTLFQRQNPRSSWFEKMMNEMLNHLERQPRNKERYSTWLELIEPVFDAMGLVLLAHFRRIFPLLFQWLHDDDDKTILLVLQRTHTIIKLTWIRNTPYIERLVDELIITYKEAAMRKARAEIRNDVLQILILLQKCKGLQFEAKWSQYRDDPNLSALRPSLCGDSITMPNMVA